MHRLTLICHGPTGAGPAAFPADEPLDAGRLPALDALRAQVRNADHLFTGPLLRARQSATALGLDAGAEPALDDLDLGRWRGRPLAGIAAAEPEAVAAWRADPQAAPHGGESRAHLQARIETWLAARADARGHTVAVTHPAVIRAAVLHVLNAPPDGFWCLDVEPFSLTDLRCDGGRWALRTFNVTPGHWGRR